MEIKERKKKGRTFTSVVIEPFKQMKFGIYVIVASLAFVIAACGFFIWAFKEQYDHVMEIFAVVDPTKQWDLVTNDVFFENAKRLGVLFVAYIGIMFTIVFKLTHRYYGPLVSIERFVDQLTKGEYVARVTIRNKDELQRLAAKLNIMAGKLEARHGARVDDDGKRIERRHRAPDQSHDEAS
jgi:HAMP domain-containing protein